MTLKIPHSRGGGQDKFRKPRKYSRRIPVDLAIIGHYRSPEHLKTALEGFLSCFDPSNIYTPSINQEVRELCYYKGIDYNYIGGATRKRITSCLDKCTAVLLFDLGKRTNTIKEIYTRSTGGLIVWPVIQ